MYNLEQIPNKVVVSYADLYSYIISNYKTIVPIESLDVDEDVFKRVEQNEKDLAEFYLHKHTEEVLHSYFTSDNKPVLTKYFQKIQDILDKGCKVFLANVYPGYEEAPLKELNRVSLQFSPDIHNNLNDLIVVYLYSLFGVVGATHYDTVEILKRFNAFLKRGEDRVNYFEKSTLELYAVDVGPSPYTPYTRKCIFYYNTSKEEVLQRWLGSVLSTDFRTSLDSNINGLLEKDVIKRIPYV